MVCPGICGSRASVGCLFCCPASVCNWGIIPCAGAHSVRGRGAGHSGHAAFYAGGQGSFFGVLTLLGSAMLLTGLLEKPLRRIPPAAGFAISAVLFALTRNVSAGYLGFGSLRLWLPQTLYVNYATAYFGFYPLWFYSTDYFALLPWLFLFWAGYFLCGIVGRQRMEPLRRSVCPPLGWLGRHSLLLYLLHQPVIYGVLLVVFRVLGG